MIFSLKLKVALAATVMVVLSIGTVGVVLHTQLEEDITRVFVSEQEAIAESLARDLADKLELHLSVLEQTALLTNVFELDTARDQQALLERTSILKTLFDGLAIIGPNGDVLVASPPTDSSRVINVGDRDYFRQAMSTGRVAISQPLIARSTAHPVIIIAVPIRDKTGQTIAIMAAGLNLERQNLLGRMNQHPVGQTGHVEVVTRGPQGVYVVHPDRSMLLKPASTLTTTASDLVSRIALRNAEWELRVVLPAWEAGAPAHEAQRRLLRWLIILSALSAVVAWGGAYWLIRPLGRLVSAIKTLRLAPDTPVQLDVHGRDEQGELAREFESLVQELQSRQQELAVISASAPIGLFRTDTTGNITWANDAYLQIHGLPTSELARGWLGLRPDGTPDAIWAAWLNVVATAKSHYAEVQIQRPDGNMRTLIVRSTPILQQGKLNGHVGTVTDITARMDSARELERQTSTLQSVAESIPAIVAVLGADEVYRYVNAAFERWFGMPRAQIVGRKRNEILSPADYAMSLDWMTRVLAGENVHFERAPGDQPQQDNQLAISYYPLRLADGQVDGFVSIAMDISQQRQKENLLTQLAQRDALTGLLNRAGFEQHLNHCMAEKQEATLAVMYIDLDHFKPVNDTYGHPAGDQLLKMFADRLRGLVRPSDAVARLGGDEFALVLSGVRLPEHADLVAEKVLQAAHTPFEFDGLVLNIGASVGVAVGANQTDGWKELVARADKLLYQAKAGGRGRHAR